MIDHNFDSEKRFRDLPYKETVFAAGDSGYIKTHAPAYISSCISHDVPCHVHMLITSDDPDSDIEFINRLIRTVDKLKPKGHVVCTYSRADDSHKHRSYYSTMRFRLAEALLSNTQLKRILITDIDSFFMKSFEWPTKPIGLYLRESLPGTNYWEALGTRVAAGIVYCDKSKVDFLTKTNAKISTYLKNHDWFIDQVALFETSMTEHPDDIHVFGQETMDWEFQDNSIMWTGKGDRKHNSERYLEAKHSYENRFFQSW